MQIGVTAASLVFAFSSDKGHFPGWWTWLGVGLVLMFTSTAMLKIGSGISANAVVLHEAGSRLGDTALPSSSSRFSSVSFWIAFTMLASGALSVTFSIILGFCHE